MKWDLVDYIIMQWFDPCSNLHSNSDVYMDSVTGHFVSLGNVTEVQNQRVHHTKNFKMLLVGSDNLKFCVGFPLRLSSGR